MVTYRRDNDDAGKSLVDGAAPELEARNNNGPHHLPAFGGRPATKRAVSYHRVFKREEFGGPARVFTVEYDPNRERSKSRCCITPMVRNVNILAPVGEDTVGDLIAARRHARHARAMPADRKKIRSVTGCANSEIASGKGGQICRAAGTYAQLVAKEGKYALLRLPSGEVRNILAACLATVGQVGNVMHENVSIGKAGRNRWLGNRPKVRGVAMNPVDHPLGGGEGKSSGGRHPVTPWGKPPKGYKTRNKKKASSKLIVKRRGQK